MVHARCSVGSGSRVFADLGHEVPTSLLPTFLTRTLGAPAAALGLIEGVADGFAGAARLAGGALADDPPRRRRRARRLRGDRGPHRPDRAVTAVWQVASCGRRVGRARPAGAGAQRVARRRRDAKAYGRAYGSSGRWTTWARSGGRPRARARRAFSVRSRSCFVIPGLLAAAAILVATGETGRRRSAASGSRSGCASGRSCRDGSASCFVGVGGVRSGERRRDAADPASDRPAHARARGNASATRIGIALYIAYNVAATVVSLPGGHLADRSGNLPVLIRRRVLLRARLPRLRLRRSFDRVPRRLVRRGQA